MNMKKIVFLFCCTLMMAACNSKQTKLTDTTHDFENDKTTLYVSTIHPAAKDTMQMKDINKLPPVINDEIRTITAPHFEVSLNEMSDGAGYMAQKTAEETSDKANMKKEFICDWCGATLTFKTTAGFLDFMKARGYKLACQTEGTHRIDYKFDKI